MNRTMRDSSWVQPAHQRQGKLGAGIAHMSLYTRVCGSSLDDNRFPSVRVSKLQGSDFKCGEHCAEREPPRAIHRLVDSMLEYLWYI